MSCFKAGRFTFPLGERTYIMGILNATPDSFSDGGLYDDPAAAARRALEMRELGADIIDIGAESTRPGAERLEDTDEIRRLAPVLEAVRGVLRAPVSVDTRHVRTARFALENGASIINDVSGKPEETMAEAVKESGAGWIIMHNPCGSSAVAEYPRGVIRAVREFFEESLAAAEAFGVGPDRVCFDPGIGFGKSHADNLLLLRSIKDIKIPGVCLLAGASRKRVVGIATGEKRPEKRAAGTVAAHTAAIAGGADIIRAHDIAEAAQGAAVADALFRKR